MNYKEKRCLVAVFSHAGLNYASGKIVDLPVGNTEVVSHMICRHTGGELFHIRRDHPYPREYKDTVDEARREKEENSRPHLETDVEDVSAYDVIFLGYPIWCGTMPMPVWTFLERHGMDGKIIKPFCTHEGSGWGRSLQDLYALCPKARIEEGLTLFGTTVADAEDDVKRWLDR